MSLIVNKIDGIVNVTLDDPIVHQDSLKKRLHTQIQRKELLRRNVTDLDNFPEEFDALVKYTENKLQENSIFCLNECVEQRCFLDRNEYPIRGIFEDYLCTEICKLETETLKYASWYPGYLFQDLIILNNIAHKFKEIEVSFIGYGEEFVDLLSEGIYVPKEIQDTNPKRRSWRYMLACRLVSFLSWFQQFHNLKITVKLYRDMEHLIDQQDKFHAFVGVDYIDEFYIFKYMFKMCAGMCTLPGGIIGSLRTDGIPFVLSQVFLSMEIYRNTEIFCQQMKNFWNQYHSLQGMLDDHKIRIKADPELKIETKVIEKNGITYKCTGSWENGYDLYLSDKYFDLFDKKRSSENEIFRKVLNTHSSKSIYHIEGFFKFYLWILLYKLMRW